MSEEFYYSYEADSATLSIGGPLDADTVESLERFIEERRVVDVIDCTGVTLLAAAGVAALLRIGDSESITMLPSNAVLKTLGICGLDKRFRSGPAPHAT